METAAAGNDADDAPLAKRGVTPGKCNMSEPGPLVLYVEDEVLIRELGVAMLEDAGFSVVAHPGAAAAIQELVERGPDFAALVTDIDLGAGPSGWDIARQARDLNPVIPVVYVSGGSASDWPSNGVPDSVVLSKPYATAQLVVAVANATVAKPSSE